MNTNMLYSTSKPPPPPPLLKQITSAFWFAFTTGRLGSGALYSVFSRAPYVALWCQIGLMGSGLGAILLFPSSTGTLWTGKLRGNSGPAYAAHGWNLLRTPASRQCLISAINTAVAAVAAASFCSLTVCLLILFSAQGPRVSICF